MFRQKFLEIIIPPLIERGLYCNHLVRPSVRPFVHPFTLSYRYLSFYWKKWLHIYFLFTVRLTNERVGVFLVRRSVQPHFLFKLYRQTSYEDNDISTTMTMNFFLKVNARGLIYGCCWWTLKFFEITTREPFLNKMRDIGSNESLVVFPMSCTWP
jgi:hypothetical protein